MKTLKYLIIILLFTSSCNTLETSHPITNSDFPLVQDWSFATDESIRGISVFDGWVVISEPFQITAVDTDSGELLWAKEHILDPDSLPLISDELLAIESANQIEIINRAGNEVALFSLDRKSENAELLAFYSNYLFVLRTPSWVLDVYNIETKLKLWGIPVGRGRVNIDIDSTENIAYISTLSFISAYNVESGQLFWEHERRVSNSTFDSGVLYYYETISGTSSYISAFDVKSERDLWRMEFEPSSKVEVYSMTVLNNSLIIATNQGLVAIDKENGHETWKSDSSEKFSTNPVMMGNILYARGTTSRIIYAISPENGSYLGYIKFDDSAVLGISDYESRSAIIVSGKSLIFSYAKNVYSYKD